jgi:uncharacterized protein (DUF983 family)
MQINNTFSAQLQCKCPRCWKGDIFKYSASNILKFSKTNTSCSNCNASFEPEPGFYYGAMFVSYALTVVLFVVVGVSLYVLFHPSDEVYLISIGIAALLFTPLSFRYSRVLFLYWFGGIGTILPASL